MNRRLLIWLAALLPSLGGAVGLGEIQGRAVIGRPLHLQIPLIGGEELGDHARCVRVIPEGDDSELMQMTVRTERRALTLTSTRGVNQPVLRFRIRIGCPAFLEESFVVLADPPALIPEKLVSDAPKVFGNAAVTDKLVISSPTTLRLISRKRYPGSSAQRVRFIERIAEVNPELFATIEAAYDQVLLQGTELRLPAGIRSQPSAAPVSEAKPVQPTERNSEATASRAVAKPAPPNEGKGKGRLVIGAAELPKGKGPTNAELNESIERLTDALNEQAKIELAALERLRALEAELAELKRRAAAEKAALTRMEAEMAQMRDKMERDNTIKLILAILLGGVLFAFILRWIADHRARKSAMATAVPQSVGVKARSIVTPSSPRQVLQTKASDDELEELLPSKQ